MGLKEGKKATIGIFDSGVGGLSVWRELVKILPYNNFIYFSDSAYCPYGPRPQEEVIKRACKITDFLISQGADIIVVACNTATAAAIETLREKYTLSFVGMEPAVKPAALHSKTGVIGVLATKGTFKGKLYSRTLQKFASDLRVVEQVGYGLVELVEAGKTSEEETSKILRQYILPMIALGADHIVLGCTHYPFLRDEIQKIAGDNVIIVDPAPAVARHTFDLLSEKNLIGKEQTDSLHQTVFYSTGNIENLVRMARRIQQSLPGECFKEKLI